MLKNQSYKIKAKEEHQKLIFKYKYTTQLL